LADQFRESLVSIPPPAVQPVLVVVEAEAGMIVALVLKSTNPPKVSVV